MNVSLVWPSPRLRGYQGNCHLCWVDLNKHSLSAANAVVLEKGPVDPVDCEYGTVWQTI